MGGQVRNHTEQTNLPTPQKDDHQSGDQDQSNDVAISHTVEHIGHCSCPELGDPCDRILNRIAKAILNFLLKLFREYNRIDGIQIRDVEAQSCHAETNVGQLLQVIRTAIGEEEHLLGN